jgi:hypothetical protein
MRRTIQAGIFSFGRPAVWLYAAAASLNRCIAGRYDDHLQVNRQLAHAVAGHRLRLPDRDYRLRAALDAWILPHPDVDRASLGPRRLRLCAGFAEFAVGHRPAAWRHHRRSLRHRPRAVRRRIALRPGAGADGSRDQRAAARYLGRRAGRLRACRLFVSRGARGVRQDRAAAMAFARLRFRHRGRLVRAISLFAGCGRADGFVRLAADAGDLCREHAHGAATVVRLGDAAFGSRA